jgi:hypothetical protein
VSCCVGGSDGDASNELQEREGSETLPVPEKLKQQSRARKEGYKANERIHSTVTAVIFLVIIFFLPKINSIIS